MSSLENQTIEDCLKLIRNQVARLEHDRNRLLVLATKYCPQEHHDWNEILHLASRAENRSKT